MEQLGLDLGPLSILYCWQSCLLAVGVSSVTHGVKRILDVLVGGKEARQKKLIVNRIVLPATPILLGALGAMVVPIHPDALTAYITARGLSTFESLLCLAAYGGAVGQFADYFWHRISGITGDVAAKKAAKKAAGGPAGAPEAPAPAQDPSPAPPAP